MWSLQQPLGFLMLFFKIYILQVNMGQTHPWCFFNEVTSEEFHIRNLMCPNVKFRGFASDLILLPKFSCLKPSEVFLPHLPYFSQPDVSLFLPSQ